MKQARIWCIVSLLLGCAAETDATQSNADAEPPKLLAQRVTATVQRSATWLVHLETEHETLITTPEHPFATLEAGWVGAGQLVPGDRVVSAKFGVVRVLSAHQKMLSHPVPVFNLSVNPSHAYLVGTDQVLVHNTKCNESAPGEDALTRHTRRLEELDRLIQALNAELESAQDKTKIQKSLDELQVERRKVSAWVRKLKFKDKQKRGEHVPLAERLLKSAEAAYESAKKKLEATQRALRELETQAARSDAERRAAQTRKAELERTFQLQKSDQLAAERIVIWEKRVVEIERSWTTEGKRPELERERAELKVKIATEKKNTSNRAHMRKVRTDPERREVEQEVRRLRRRSAADAERSNDLPEDPTTDALYDGLTRESEDVSEALRALNEELQRSPSPERMPEVQASFERFSRELAEERQNFERLDIALGTQATALREQLEGPGSSRTIEEIRAQLLRTQAERVRIRREWQERMQARLDEARRHLRDMQMSNSFRDEVIEAELAQQITLLEYELAVPPFKT